VNLDPYGRVSDARLWEVLECVQLKGVVAALPGGLDFMVSDGGDNLSLGERQLVCLARALVRDSRIVLLDEATAALDFATDQLMRRLVARHFAHATVLTIAHRLNTILDADRIMVFDAGKLVEFDSPANLLSDEKGYLSWLVEETNSAGKLHKQINDDAAVAAAVAAAKAAARAKANGSAK
jgi:ABC-type multidrug transport system fused ATPase/permease subunit